METFYCNRCGRHKNIELKIDRHGHKPVCKLCDEKANKKKMANEKSRISVGKFAQKSYAKGVMIYINED